MSVFTEILQELADYSKAVDACTVSHENFLDFQRLEDRIERAYQNGYYSHSEKKALYNIAQAIHKDFRLVLGLDR